MMLLFFFMFVRSKLILVYIQKENCISVIIWVRGRCGIFQKEFVILLLENSRVNSLYVSFYVYFFIDIFNDF